jgi:hypothetical protein
MMSAVDLFDTTASTFGGKILLLMLFDFSKQFQLWGFRTVILPYIWFEDSAIKKNLMTCDKIQTPDDHGR